MADLDPVEVNARNLLCPLPVIRTQNAVEDLPNGARVVVYCTDPGALNDIPAWCRIHGHRLITTREEDREVVVEIEVVRETTNP